MQKTNKIVLFDIDRTIFDTNQYRNNLFTNLANELGLDPKKFYPIGENIYEDIRKTTKYLPPELFLTTVLAHAKNPTNLKRLQAIFWNKNLYESCIFPDVKKAFSYLAEKNIRMGIFSTGDPAHQQIKIGSLKEYLTENHVHISPDKLKIIKNTFDIYKNNQTYLVDDFPQILESAKAHNKNIYTIFVKRTESYKGLVIPENFKPDATITSLAQLPDIISTNN